MPLQWARSLSRKVIFLACLLQLPSLSDIMQTAMDIHTRPTMSQELQQSLMWVKVSLEMKGIFGITHSALTQKTVSRNHLQFLLCYYYQQVIQCKLIVWSLEAIQNSETIMNYLSCNQMRKLNVHEFKKLGVVIDSSNPQSLIPFPLGLSCLRVIRLHSK